MISCIVVGVTVPRKTVSSHSDSSRVCAKLTGGKSTKNIYTAHFIQPSPLDILQCKTIVEGSYFNTANTIIPWYILKEQ